MSKLVKFIFYICLVITILSTHVYVATEFYSRGIKKGYESGVADVAMYMYAICTKESNVYFAGDPTAYYCAKAIKL